ncbi:hypothetical protein IE53DRAFT_413222 [Violaceomyces palustris]|uniref:Uncharacterized protein n=1 Tax=Violaceomyces palustris TaxID=1673888 RepID=A0ACD0NMX3_9BASI|nr:hypothetical protein IE53DRAFT_413222 [Violaceomyces palustris]
MSSRAAVLFTLSSSLLITTFLGLASAQAPNAVFLFNKKHTLTLAACTNPNQAFSTTDSPCGGMQDNHLQWCTESETPWDNGGGAVGPSFTVQQFCDTCKSFNKVPFDPLDVVGSTTCCWFDTFIPGLPRCSFLLSDRHKQIRIQKKGTTEDMGICFNAENFIDDNDRDNDRSLLGACYRISDFEQRCEMATTTREPFDAVNRT